MCGIAEALQHHRAGDEWRILVLPAAVSQRGLEKALVCSARFSRAGLIPHRCCPDEGAEQPRQDFPHRLL
jgi:hypothetical protein